MFWFTVSCLYVVCSQSIIKNKNNLFCLFELVLPLALNEKS